MNAVQTLWDTEYRDNGPDISQSTSNVTASMSRDFIAFDDFLDVSNDNIAFKEDSYTIYCEPSNRISDKDCSDSDIIEW